MKIYPSLISSDILNLERTIRLLDPHCDGYHIDVMDFHFVPNLTWGPQFINAIAKTTQKPLHVHFMVKNPEQWISRLQLRRSDSFIFHYESIEHKEQIPFLVDEIKKVLGSVGIAISPATDVSAVFPYLKLLDTVLIMSVNPGFSGQKFMSTALGKTTKLAEEKKERNYSFSIGMDGGVELENINQIATIGVDYVACASAIFDADDPVDELKKLYEISKK